MGMHNIIVKPLEILRPLVLVGLVDMKSLSNTARKYNFLGKQNKFIENDLRKCKKQLGDCQITKHNNLPECFIKKENTLMLVSTRTLNQPQNFL